VTAEGWRKLIVQVVREADVGDGVGLELLAETLHEHDAAKQLLRDAGYGCIGLSLLRTVEEAIAAHA
jgi:hypothetical protein